MARAKKYTKSGFYDVLKDVDKRIKHALLRGAWAMRDAARDLSKLGEKEVRKSIIYKGSYKKYYKKGVERMSSHPGNPPAAVKGEDLEPSIYSRVTSGPKRNPATAEFGSTAPFAADLEFGTTKIQPRPFLRPAKKQVRDMAPLIVVDHLVTAYRKSLSGAKATTVVIDMDM
jgi:HK97 gp10 family phage protein